VLADLVASPGRSYEILCLYDDRPDDVFERQAHRS
jgi:hypothetical protein